MKYRLLYCTNQEEALRGAVLQAKRNNMQNDLGRQMTEQLEHSNIQDITR